MIDGITVLNQIEISTPTGLGIFFGVVAFLVVVILFGVLTKFEGWSSAIGSIIGIIAFVFITNASIEPTGCYKYECLIDKSVSMTEVYEKYKVIEQRGEIWVLEDKE